jgi:biopolymer transport protein ExbD
MINVSGNNRKNVINDFLPDLTPLLDVVFMLIIFLILTINSTSFSLEINLPEDTDKSSKIISENNNISVYILKNKWKIGDSLFLLENNFKSELKKTYQKNIDKKIIIISDKDASIKKLISLLTFLKKENIKMANILVERN